LVIPRSFSARTAALEARVSAQQSEMTMLETNPERLPLAFGTAEEQLCRNVPVLSPRSTAGQGRAEMLGKPFELVTDLAVCDGERLVGMVTIERLLAAPEEVLVGDLMDPDPPMVHLSEDQEIAAWKAVQHGERSIAVVDGAQRFKGLIPPRRLLSVLLHEHHEDLARLAGVMHSARGAREPLQEPVVWRFIHRLPWLLVGLLGALISADAVSWFERDLQTNMALAFFLPAIVYIADAVGTQTETLAIRGLSVGIPIGSIVWREVITGVIIGLGLALVAAPLLLWRWQEADITLVVTLALVATSSVATTVAIVLPWMINRFGADPAFGSGPLATVIQDLLSIVIYLGIAALALR
jgi:magnesium transporter